MHWLSYFCAEPTASYNVVATQPVIMMSDKEATADDKCQACHGAGTVAGARPVRTGPFLLNPPLCRVCGGTGREPRSKHPKG
jgi:DnaJ-class molecular chaperone